MKTVHQRFVLLKSFFVLSIISWFVILSTGCENVSNESSDYSEENESSVGSVLDEDSLEPFSPKRNSIDSAPKNSNINDSLISENIGEQNLLQTAEQRKSFVPGQILVELKSNKPGFVNNPQIDSVISEIAQEYGAFKAKNTFEVASRVRSFSKHAKAIQKKFKKRTARRTKGAKVPNLGRYFTLTFSVGDDQLQEILIRIKKSPNIKSASLNYILKASAIPNDPYFSSSNTWGQTYRDMWGLEIIEARKAWNLSTGDSSIIVAVIDTGVDATHPDIANNMYSNSGETASNSIDDDANGYVDDVGGWDFSNVDADPTDDHGHGTHVSGTIAAEGDNSTGIVGVMWDAQILPVKVLDEYGSGSYTDVASGIEYAADMGADVINLSLGGSSDSSTMEAAIQYAYGLGVVVVAAAGNDGRDAFSTYPANYGEVITVASSTENDTLSEFSNNGPKIDIAAPGGGDEDSSSNAIYRNILSLRASGTDMYGDGDQIVDTDYYRARGTSMATPHVAGAVGLLLSYDFFTVEEVRQALRLSAIDIGDAAWDMDAAYGRLNLFRLLNNTTSHCEARITDPDNYDLERGVLTTNAGDKLMIPISGIAGGENFSKYRLDLYQGSPESSTKLASSKLKSKKVSAAGSLGTFNFISYDPGLYTVKLVVYDSAGNICGRDLRTFHYSPYTADYSFVEDTSFDLNLGESLAMGDINGDGADDILMGASGCKYAGSCTTMYDFGQIYLAYGNTAGLTTDTAVSDTSLVPVSWLSVDQDDRLGVSVKIADLDGDAYGDVILGAPGASDNGTTSGTICVFLGKNYSAWTRDMAIASADYCFYGEAADDRMGYIIDAGDFDGDGLDDITTSACGFDGSGTDLGRAYIIYASDLATASSTSDIADVAATTIDGISDTTTTMCSTVYFGRGMTVANVGDFNGDSLDDLAIGMTSDDDGYVHIFNGSASKIANGTVDDSSSATTASTTFEEDENGRLGERIVAVGDVNGDGYDDFLAGYIDAWGLGGSRLFTGSNSYTTTFNAASTSNSANWYTDWWYFGYCVSGIGDIDSDGLDDMAFGAFLDEHFDASGLVYVKKGSTSGFTSGLYDLESDFILKDDEDESVKGWFGHSISHGDFDHDGNQDIAVSAPSYNSMVYIFSLQ